MTREQYVTIVRGLLSGDPKKVREANQELFREVVPKEDGEVTRRSADLVLAEIAD